MKVRRILVPIDFSPESVAAAGVAADLARQLGARLRLLTVLDVSDLRVALKARLYAFKTDAEVHRAVLRWIREQYDRLALPGDVLCTRSIRRGMVEAEIISAVKKNRPQLVVMGSWGLARRLPLGSKTAAILRRCTVPVLVVKKPVD